MNHKPHGCSVCFFFSFAKLSYRNFILRVLFRCNRRIPFRERNFDHSRAISKTISHLRLLISSVQMITQIWETFLETSPKILLRNETRFSTRRVQQTCTSSRVFVSEYKLTIGGISDPKLILRGRYAQPNVLPLKL